MDQFQVNGAVFYVQKLTVQASIFMVNEVIPT